MVIFQILLLILLYGSLCLSHVIIHETGHFLCVKKWAKRLKLNSKETYVIIGDENSKMIKKFGIYRIMSKDCFKTGMTVSPFYKLLARGFYKNKIKIIKNNAISGGKAIALVGLFFQYFLNSLFFLSIQCFSITLTATVTYLVFSFAGILLIIFISKNSMGPGKENSDYDFWKNPQKFTPFFK